jgi:hypothetical protein
MGSRIGRKDNAAMVTRKQTGQIEIEIEKILRPRLREPDGELSNRPQNPYHTDRAAAENRERRGQHLQFRDRRWQQLPVHNLLLSYQEKLARF